MRLSPQDVVIDMINGVLSTGNRVGGDVLSIDMFQNYALPTTGASANISEKRPPHL
jgi:hypothetical protein